MSSYPQTGQWPGNGMQNNFYGVPNHLMPNPQAFVGITHSGNLPPFRRPTFAEAIQLKYPMGQVQVLPLLNRISKGKTMSLQETYMVKSAWIPRLKLAETMPAARRLSYSSIKVDTTEGLIPNMTFVTGPFGEQVMITDVTGANELVVLRGLSSVIPREVPKGTQFLYSGDVFEEGSMRPLMRMSGASEYMVHTQIFRHSWGQTNSVRESLLAQDAKSGGIYGISPGDSKEEAMINHANAIESWLLFGKHQFTTYNGMPMRMAAGIFEFISANAPQNIVTALGGLNMTDLGKIFNSRSELTIEGAMTGNPTMFVHEAVIYALTDAARMQGVPGYSVGQLPAMNTGQQITSFTTPTGTFNMVPHPRFKMEPSLYGAALALDPSSFALKYLGDRDTQHTYYGADASGKLSPLSDPTGIDQVGGTFTTEVMLACRNPAANGIYFNLTKGRAAYDSCCGHGNAYK